MAHLRTFRTLQVLVNPWVWWTPALSYLFQIQMPTLFISWIVQTMLSTQTVRASFAWIFWGVRQQSTLVGCILINIHQAIPIIWLSLVKIHQQLVLSTWTSIWQVNNSGIWQRLISCLASSPVNGFVLGFSLSAGGSSEIISIAATAGYGLGNYLSGSVISFPSSFYYYTVYLLNQGNYSIFQQGHTPACINPGCSTTLSSPWSFSYTYPTSGTYYLIITCKDSVEACNFLLNANFAGIYNLVLVLSNFY